MSALKSFQSRDFNRFSLCGAALLLPFLAIAPARGDIIPVRQMAQGIASNPTQCAAFPNAVWVVAAKRGFCIRYYISTIGGEGRVPIVWLSGDKLGTVDMRTRRFKVEGDQKDVNTDNLQKIADVLSKNGRTTAIYLARPGLDGSSGYHGYRRSWLELYAVSAALDAIRQKHGFQGFHVAGQSGGSGLIGGLMGIRQDLSCVVPGAGRLALLKPRKPEQDPTLEFFDASQAIQRIARNRTMRILVVTDPQDKRVRVEHQSAFVRALRAAGGHAEQFFVQATDDNRHGVAVYTRFVVAACARGMDTKAIMAGLARVQERHLARSGGGNPNARPAGEPPQQPYPRHAQAQPQQPYAQPQQPYHPPQAQPQRPHPQQGQPQQPYAQPQQPYYPPQAQPQRPQPQPQQPYAQPQQPYYPPQAQPRQAQPQQPYAQPQQPYYPPQAQPQRPHPQQGQPQQPYAQPQQPYYPPQAQPQRPHPQQPYAQPQHPYYPPQAQPQQPYPRQAQPRQAPTYQPQSVPQQQPQYGQPQPYYPPQAQPQQPQARPQFTRPVPPRGPLPKPAQPQQYTQS